MAWQSLGNLLNTKPQVLAGPMLRKVTPKTVTVWVALRSSAKVTLTVLDTANKKQMEGSRATIQLGTHLHIVAVTATLQPMFGDLREGVIYRYNLRFEYTDGSSPEELGPATHNADLAYGPVYTSPSFCLPPADINSLRIVHGSCRIPHGQGTDELPLLDDLIAQAPDNPLARPHQLFQTDDQIYADDVAASLLVMLTDAADTLLGWKEVLPIAQSQGGPRTGAELPPFVRRRVLESLGFPSVDLDAHLMTFVEAAAVEQLRSLATKAGVTIYVHGPDVA